MSLLKVLDLGEYPSSATDIGGLKGAFHPIVIRISLKARNSHVSCAMFLLMNAGVCPLLSEWDM